jgi:hypothetical protein
MAQADEQAKDENVNHATKHFQHEAKEENTDQHLSLKLCIFIVILDTKSKKHLQSIQFLPKLLSNG